MKNHKKGVTLTMQTIVVAILVLVVLVVLIMVFRGQVGKSVQRYFGIGEAAEKETNATLMGKKCATLFGGRICIKTGSCPAGPKGEVVYVEIPPPPEGWSDCKGTCCEKVS